MKIRIINSIAFLFRALNYQLLYRRGLINKFLKITYFISVSFFNLWAKRKRVDRLTVISNFDGSTNLQIDISKRMGAALFWTGFHEFNEMRFLGGWLKPEMVFVDIGANQGEYTLFAAKRLTEGRILAFEPLSLFYQRLNYNIGLNNFKNVTTYKLGLSDHSGEHPIYFNAENKFQHEGLATLYPDKEDNNSEIIRLATLDEIVESVKTNRVDFIKIDIEGAEWFALKGAQQTLKKFKPALMIELNRGTSEKAGYSIEDMVLWLAEFGYTGYAITKVGLREIKEYPSFSNTFFIAD